MELVKEYKWWILFLIALACSLFAVKSCQLNEYKDIDIAANWEKNEAKILVAKQYFESITPRDFLVSIEFESKDFIKHISLTQFGGESIELANDNVTVNSPNVKGLCDYLKWKVSDLEGLYEVLRDANCISIANNDPISVGYKRTYFGKYSYMIFDKPIADSIFKVYNDTCRFKYHSKKIILEYGGGAIGKQCF